MVDQGSGLVQLDYRQVHQDILSRRTCRMTIFITTVTALATSGLVLIAMIESEKVESLVLPASVRGSSGGQLQERQPVGEGEDRSADKRPQIVRVYSRSDWRKWVSLGMFIPLALLLIGILTLLQKTRSIYDRVAYLAVLGEYLREEKTPEQENYRGWAGANMAVEHCRSMLHSAHGMTACNKPSGESCISLAKTAAQRENTGGSIAKTFGPLKSFTALTATIYAVLLLVVGAATITAFWRGLNMRWDQEIATALVPMLILLLVDLLLLAIAKHRGQQPRNLFERAYMVMPYWVTIGFFCAAPTSVIRLLKVWPESWTVCFGFAAIGICNILVGAGVVLVHQLYHLRVGKYSLETCYHAWKERLKRCPFPK